MRYYLDTSAYLAVLLGEQGGTEILREVGRGQILSSVLLVLEACRNLVRYSREGILPATDLGEYVARVVEDSQHFLLRDLTLDLCTGLRMPIVSTPRSLDLAHLRTALWFHERQPLTRFVSLDESLVVAARELGLPTDRQTAA